MSAAGWWAVALFVIVCALALKRLRRDPGTATAKRDGQSSKFDWSDDDLSWLQPPPDGSNAAAWDRYWQAQAAHGNITSGFNDMMASDPTLPALMRRRGVRTVLCAGNGLSAEPHVLSRMGFEVTALDLSPWVTEAAMKLGCGPEHPMHRSEATAAHAAPVGEPTYVMGDLLDATVCSGTFDCVIERRTAQLVPDRDTAFDRLAARLAAKGLLVSHFHDGAWRPGKPLDHPAKRWASGHGFSTDENAHRMILLRYTTG
jgi:hypothetical protein